MKSDLESLVHEINALRTETEIGRVQSVEGNLLKVRGLDGSARLANRVTIRQDSGRRTNGEVISLNQGELGVLPEASPDGIGLDDFVEMTPAPGLRPSRHWIGRVIDPDGQPLDGRALIAGSKSYPLRSAPPPPTRRRQFGERLHTGLAVLDTMLPIVNGQRLGLFAGSGVGKSTLIGQLACNLKVDVVVLALIGERGRELGHFVENVLGSEGMARSVVVAATSDQSPVMRRRCAFSAMAVAEYFRDQGRHVLLLADSVTRFAEAHREVAVAAGELPALRGFPPSMAHNIMALCERAGPGAEKNQGDITAVFSVLVAGSDMEEPIADILRGVLDGHIVLDRDIAERGRFPAVNVLNSVSRSLPDAATAAQNTTIGAVRRLMGLYQENETMLRAGLYKDGSDAEIDASLVACPEFEKLWAETGLASIEDAFARLDLTLRRVGVQQS